MYKLVTNFTKKYENRYIKAIEEYYKETGDNCLIISSNAYGYKDKLDPTAKALYTSEDKNLSRFWHIFNNITK